MLLTLLPTTTLSCFPIPNHRASLDPVSTRASRHHFLAPPRRTAACSGPPSLFGKWRCNAGEESEPTPQRQGSEGLDWPILERWEVPWEWPTLSLTFLACGLSFVLTGLVGTAALPYLGLHLEELSLDEKAEILLLDQGLLKSSITRPLSWPDCLAGEPTTRFHIKMRAKETGT